MVQDTYLESFVDIDDNLKPVWGQKSEKCRLFFTTRWRKIKILITSGYYLGLV